MILGHDPVCQPKIRGNEHSERMTSGECSKSECGVMEVPPTQRRSIRGPHPLPRAAASLGSDHRGGLRRYYACRLGFGHRLTCSHCIRPMERSVRMRSIVQRGGNRELGRRGQSFQVGRTRVSELASRSEASVAVASE